MGTANLLIVAAEAREFSGLLKRLPSRPSASSYPWPAAFARDVTLPNGRNATLLANGCGPRLIHSMLRGPAPQVAEIVSTGFCGALDPSLHIGDIVEATPADILSQDRVIVHAEEKQRLWRETRARIVDMEFAAVAAKAREWGLPCRAVRVVTDTAQEDLPLDLNRYRDKAGRFQLTRIAAAGLLRPFTALPGLIRLDRNSRFAANKLGAFIADSKF